MLTGRVTFPFLEFFILHQTGGKISFHLSKAHHSSSTPFAHFKERTSRTVGVLVPPFSCLVMKQERN